MNLNKFRKMIELEFSRGKELSRILKVVIDG